jgi:hypothetical protein
MTTLPAHSRVGASGMSRWELAHCPGSVQLSAGLESKAGYAAAEGTVAHGVAEAMLDMLALNTTAGAIVEQDGFSIEVTPVMLDHCADYKDIIDSLCNENTVRHVEHKFHLDKLHPALFGTADCVLWDPVRRHLDVVDFKYGAGHGVEARDNVQLQYYAVGAVMTLGYNPATIDLHIVQPRYAHPEGTHRTASMDPMDLLDFAAYLVASVKETEKPDAAIRAGEWCRYCPAAGIPGKCPEQSRHANELAKVAFTPVEPGTDVLPYNPDELADWLDRLPILEAQIKAVREFAYNEAEAGRAPPRYKLVEKQAREKWTPAATPEKLARKFKLSVKELRTEPELISPAQLRKLLPGKNDKERSALLAQAGFTVKESSGHTLVHEDDRRPPVRALNAGSEFLPAE